MLKCVDVSIMSLLGNFLGSKFLARILKLFVLTPDASFTRSEILEKVNGHPAAVFPILKRMVTVKFLIAKNSKPQKRYQLNPRFAYLPEIKRLVLKEVPVLDNEITSAIKKISGIEFAAVGGVLVGDKKGMVDLLAVSDRLNRAKFKKIIRNLEVEIGREVNFTLMDSKEFSYRHDLCDKFIMVMMEEPNIVIVNKLKLEDKENQNERSGN